MTLDDLRRQLKTERKLRLTIKAIPKSSRNEIAAILDDGSLRVKTTAAPEKGKANAEICDFLAGQFGVGRRNVEVIRGHTSANKKILISL